MFSALGAQGATFRILTNFSDSSHFDLNFSISPNFSIFGEKGAQGWFLHSVSKEFTHFLGMPRPKSEKVRKVGKSHFWMKKLIFGENDENDQILAFLRFRTPKTPKIP